MMRLPYHNYEQFFIFGDGKTPMPNSIEIYNKTGYAYGTITECAYIKDLKHQIDFLVTATILVNRNEIFNDSVYEYNTAGIPFLAELGRVLYKKELQRIQ